ncbi:MFS transporter [Candidatus Saccharibacteria bacterium RIFCSPHIGHO2_12_FULL_41_12]|nr:MAG: MFS transporter [Candidatus Saccharibacteria bacterium RIFCSPHIGHO2_12_FULL_41_12]
MSSSTDKQEQVYRKTIRVLVGSQLMAGAGLAAGISVGALLAEEMTGSTGAAGLPAALFTLGSAIAAGLVGRISQSHGRRIGLGIGYSVGATGAAGIVLAAILGSLPLLFVSLLLYGSGTATNLQARYAGADLAKPSRRGRAISTVLVATTLGAVLGPNLIELTGSIAGSLGVRELAGPFMLAVLAYGTAGVVVFVFMRPDPLLMARALASRVSQQTKDQKQTTSDTDSRRTVRLAAAAMIITQMVMIAIMTMTPIHMRSHEHSLAAVGLIISIHIAAMYLPSPLTGLLVDRFGYRRILASGGLILLATGILASVAPASSMILLGVTLGLLGLGWNFGLIAGTAAVTQATPLSRRASTQGSVDLAVSLAGATGGMGSGFIMASSSFAMLGLVGGLLGLAILPLLIAYRE